MQSKIRQFLGDESGATAIEYGLIAGLIAVALIGAFAAFGSSMTSMFAHVESSTTNAMTAANGG
jgi:pilus assembly protein Flp/PilA